MTSIDATTFTTLVEHHRPALHGHCRRMLGSHADADDAVQETFLRAWRSRDALRQRASARPWLYRIATNACLDTIAARRPQGDDALLAGVAADPAQEPPARAERAETLALALMAAAQHLPPKQRTALVAVDVLGWRATEAAELLGESVPAVRSALQRARAGIAPHLAEALGRPALV